MNHQSLSQIDQILRDLPYVDQLKIDTVLSYDPSHELLKELIKIFNFEVPDKISKIKKEFATQNYLEIGKIAHRIRSTSLNLGTARLTEVFKRLEYLSAEPKASSNEIESLIQTAEKEYKYATEKLKDKNILVVDDSPDSRLLLTFILKQFGAHLDTAQDGKTAIDKVLKPDSKFDLVLMDLQMPIIGGHEALSILRKSGFNKPIIALSAQTEKTEKEKCLSNGFTHYLTKPIERDTLINMISNSL